MTSDDKSTQCDKKISKIYPCDYEHHNNLMLFCTRCYWYGSPDKKTPEEIFIITLFKEMEKWLLRKELDKNLLTEEEFNIKVKEIEDYSTKRSHIKTAVESLMNINKVSKKK